MSDVAVRQGGEMQRRTPSQELIAFVRQDDFQSQLALALPDNVPASRFVRATVTALLNDPRLADGLDFDSLVVSLMRCAQAGLLPDGREAAIVRYSDKAQFIPMIAGIRKVAAEYGWTIDTKVVRVGDEFEYQSGMEPRLTHRPALGQRGDLLYAYAIARHRDGRREIEVMDASEIAKVRKASRAASKGPWVDWEERMWEKSVGHRVGKRLPFDPGDKRVSLILDAEEIGPEESARMLYGPGGSAFAAREIEQNTDPPQGAADDGAPEAAVDQQAEGAVSSGDESPAPPSAPGFKVPDPVIDAAGKTPVQDGWTVASVCADEKGREWVAWLLGPEYDGSVDERVVAAVRLYVTARCSELS